MINVCYSGGAAGADSIWGECAEEVGHEVVHFGFNGMNQSNKEFFCLNIIQLLEADEHLIRANKVLKRGKFPYSSEYVNNLLRRNFYQVRDTERVYAVAPMGDDGTVRGGTGWTVQMAVDLRVPEIYLFNIVNNNWYKSIKAQSWECISYTPLKPHGRYTGIGSREITDAGIETIRSIYK